MYRVVKPMKCSKCKGGNIAKPTDSDSPYDLVCLDCGHKREKPITTTSGKTSHWAYVLIEDEPYEEF